MLAGLVAIVLLAIAYFFAIPEAMREPPGETQSAASVPKPEPITTDRFSATVTVACRDFRRLLEDMKSGVLNDHEIREQAKKIRENTRLSDSADVRAAGDALVRSMTTGTIKDVNEAMKQLANACAKR